VGVHTAIASNRQMTIKEGGREEGRGRARSAIASNCQMTVEEGGEEGRRRTRSAIASNRQMTIKEGGTGMHAPPLLQTAKQRLRRAWAYTKYSVAPRSAIASNRQTTAEEEECGRTQSTATTRQQRSSQQHPALPLLQTAKRPLRRRRGRGGWAYIEHIVAPCSLQTAKQPLRRG